MKKLFTLVCAAIFSVGLMAEAETIFSATPTATSKQSIAASSEAVVTDSQAAITGGTMTVVNGTDKSIDFIQSQSSSFAFALTATTHDYKIVLSKAIQAGDIVSVSALTNGSGLSNARGLFVTTTTAHPGGSANPDCKLLAVADSKTYASVSDTVQEGDEICGKTTIYLWRATGNNTYFKDFAITRPQQKEIISTTETLTKVTINDEAISATELASLVEHKSITLAEWQYLTAPVVKFTNHKVITYSDESTKVSDEVIEKTSQQASAGTWGASASIGGETYAVYTVKISSYNVNYYDGATKLGTEVVAANGTAVKHDEFAVKPLYQFINWYTDAELTHVVESWTITSDNTNFYGKWEKAYATSLDIENFVLANGMDNADADHIGDVFKDVLAGAFYAHTDINALDTLNDLDKKDNRNYAFLGLKIKKTAGHLDFNLKKGSTVKIRFGNVGASFVIKINGVDSTLTNAVANATVSSNKVFEYEASEADALIQIYGCANNKTLVIKQIMINEQISPVTLPDPSAYAVKVTAENGKVTAKVDGADYDLSKKNVLVGASVELTVAANQGFVIKEVTVNGVPANLTEGKYTFSMPAKNVEVTATFEAEATALDNTEASVKATKRIVNGMLLIEKNGEVYNVLGTRVR